MSTKNRGCFVCDGIASPDQKVCPKCGLTVDVGNLLIGQVLGDYTIEDVLGRGFYGTTVRATEQGISYAIKIIPRSRIIADQVKIGEKIALTKLAVQGTHRHLIRYFKQISGILEIQNKELVVEGLVFEYSEGFVPLNSFIRETSEPFGLQDLLFIVQAICSGLSQLEKIGFEHYDLHDDNILIRRIGSEEMQNDPFEVKIIDFGSTRSKNDIDPSEPHRTDMSYLGKHIYSLCNKYEVVNFGKISYGCNAIINHYKFFAHDLMEINKAHKKSTLAGIWSKTNQIIRTNTNPNDYPSFDEMLNNDAQFFNDPLENRNALALGHHEVSLLYQNNLNWVELLNSGSSVIVTGPRGCGKTMLFRFLSLRCKVWPEDHETTPKHVADRLSDDFQVGFVLSMTMVRGIFMMSHYRKLSESNANKAEEFTREYLNLHFALEVVNVLRWLHALKVFTSQKDEWLPLTNTISNLLIKPELATSSIEELIFAIEERVIELSTVNEDFTFTPSNFAKLDSLEKIGESLLGFGQLKEKEIWFLVDDYSSTIIPSLAQRAYNSVIFRLHDKVKIRLSMEGGESAFNDTMDRVYREGREISIVNLGQVYFEQSRRDDAQSKQFIEDIIRARCDQSGIGSLDRLKEILGENPRSHDFGEYLRSLEKIGSAQYWGFSLVCQLCSGDVSYIIELFNQLVEGKWDRGQLKPTEQHKIIKNFSSRQLNALRTIQVSGRERVFLFAENIGKLLKGYIIASKSKNTPDERIRIEIEGGANDLDETQLPSPRELHKLLIKYSVLIPGGYGKSRDSSLTEKYYIRRLFAPSLSFSPLKRGSVPLTKSSYEKWLNDPNEILKRYPKGLDDSQENLNLDDEE